MRVRNYSKLRLLPNMILFFDVSVFLQQVIPPYINSHDLLDGGHIFTDFWANLVTDNTDDLVHSCLKVN